MATKTKAEKKQHIQVFARVRPLSHQELRSQVVVECNNGKEVSVRDKNQIKTFTFDRVFGPNSKQVEVYKAVVNPLISEVLQGYNCTVFAYGQTGTGKTFTMVGEKSSSVNGNWEEDPSCGVIPRTLSHIFDELKVRADEFTVRVSFLELYNEELCDLLSPIDNEDVKTLKLFEDSMKKGSVIVSGLEERTVHNKNDVFAILETGNHRRQTAPTLMNAQSSRSHTIFTITVHIKVTTPEGEDLIKTGKLNLVDLAGSENIGRSGAVEMRAREAGSINQSLLTLGRVITALVERKPHVPYRESKLTRILQDSLGGRTKTSIIATVSPASCNIEETLSTFDYAHRARNITNKPEINQKTSKRVLLKEYTEEIERLRRDLIATREKHGVYLASENYNAIMAERDNLNKELVSKLQLLKVREDELIKQEVLTKFTEIMKNLDMNLFATQNELAVTNQKLEEATKLCTEKEGMLNELELQTNVLVETASEAVNDAKTLHERLAKSRRILENNFFSSEKFKSDFCWNLNNMRTRTKEFKRNMVYEIDNEIEMDKKFISSLMNNQLELKTMANNAIEETSTQMQTVFDSIKSQMLSNQMFFNDQLTVLKETVEVENEKAQEIIKGLMLHTENMLPNWNRLLEHLETNKFGLQKLRTDVETMEGKLIEITNMALLLSKLCEEKIKKREDALKYYTEKCDFLEKKQATIKKQMNEFGHALYKMAQEHLDLMQKENECDEALVTLINDRNGEEDYFFNDMGDVIRKKAVEIQACAEEAGTMNGNLVNLTNELIDITQAKMYPLAKNVFSSEENKYVEMKKTISISTLGSKCNKLIDELNLQNTKVGDHCPEVENKKKLLVDNFSTFMKELENNLEHQRVYAEENLQQRILQQQTLSLNVMKHSEELSLNLHERLKEIDSFFVENIKKDEKTGNTPQRKEFNYPRRIMGFLKKGEPEDCEHDKSRIFNSLESPENGKSFDSPNP